MFIFQQANPNALIGSKNTLVHVAQHAYGRILMRPCNLLTLPVIDRVGL